MQEAEGGRFRRPPPSALLVVRRERPDRPDVARLLALADERSASLYPAESRHGLSIAALLAGEARFYVARMAASKPTSDPRIQIFS